MSEVLLTLVKKHAMSNLFTRYINFTDQPRQYRGNALEDAWQRTGRHLRKAMSSYGKRQKVVVRVESKQKKSK